MWTIDSVHTRHVVVHTHTHTHTCEVGAGVYSANLRVRSRDAISRTASENATAQPGERVRAKATLDYSMRRGEEDERKGKRQDTLSYP